MRSKLQKLFGILLILLMTFPALIRANDLITELLDWRAPAPDWRPFIKHIDLNREKGEAKPPNDDAPVEVLMGFYAEDCYQTEPSTLSEKTKQRLLEGCIAKPENVPSLLNFLPKNEATYAVIKKILDKEDAAPVFRAYWREDVRNWLRLNSNYFIEDLVKIAKSAKDDDGYISKADELEALAKLDWPTAEKIFEEFSKSNQKRLATFCTSLLYEHAVQQKEVKVSNKYRFVLEKIAKDPSIPGKARDVAISSLLKSPWDGQDGWYLSLFKDPTLLELKDGHSKFSPLSEPIIHNPDKWLSTACKLVQSTNRAEHDIAVQALISFQIQRVRRDCYIPLIPWLSNPQWSSATGRLRLIQGLKEEIIPESVPGLIWVVENDKENSNRAYAGRTLVAYKDHRAIPVLKKASEEIKDEYHRRMIFEGLVACGGVSDEQAINAIEAYAMKISTSEGLKEVREAYYDILGEKNISSNLQLGQFLSRSMSDREDIVNKLLTRAKHIQKKQPELAKAIISILRDWPTKSIALDFVRMLSQGEVDKEAVLSVLDQRESFKQKVSKELAELKSKNGLVGGLATTLLGDKDRELEILRGSDIDAQRALLACSRLVRESLSVKDVSSLLKAKNVQLSFAVERYLESEDGAEARKIVLSMHPNEARILGARQNFDPGHFTFREFDEIEKDFQNRILSKNAPKEIFALVSAGYWGGAGHWVIEFTGDGARIVRKEDEARYKTRQLTRAEIKKVQDFIQSNKVDDLPPLATQVWDGIQYEYLHITKEGGRRIFMNNPGSASTGGSVYDLLVKLIQALERTGTWDLKYYTADQFDGFEVLCSDPKTPCVAVWKQSDDLRIRVFDEELRSGSWRAWSNGKLLDLVETPPDWNKPFREDLFPKWLNVREDLNPWSIDNGYNNSTIWASWGDKKGLWICTKGKEPKSLFSGEYAHPLVTPDGKWLIAEKTDSQGWADPNYVVRIDLKNKKEYRVNVPAADNFTILGYIPLKQKALLYRQKDQDSNNKSSAGPENPEFLVLNVETGDTEVVQGEFYPWFEKMNHPFQKVHNSDDVWVTVYDKSSKSTKLGHYDTKTFSFDSIMEIPFIRIGNNDFWVDEDNSKVYVTYQNHLLRLPLKKRIFKSSPGKTIKF